MKFYDCATAPSPRRVRIFAAEKGIELPTVQVDLRSGEHFGEAFRAVNPTCTVPVLELDDGTCIYESVAVCRYLEAAHPEPPLMGSSPAEQGVVAMWDHRIEIEGFQAAAEMFRNTARGMKDHALPGPDPVAQIPELAERGRMRVGRFFETLDAQLDGREFVTGPRYTAADITALVAVDFINRLKVETPEGCGNVRRWHEAVSARPSASA